jgi:hypothetical protein
MNIHKILGDDGKSQLSISMTDHYVTIRIVTRMLEGNTLRHTTRDRFEIEADGTYPNVHKVIDDFIWAYDTNSRQEAIIHQRVRNTRCSFRVAESNSGSGSMLLDIIRGTHATHRSGIGNNCVEIALHKSNMSSKFALFFSNLILALQEDKQTVTTNRYTPGNTHTNVR